MALGPCENNKLGLRPTSVSLKNLVFVPSWHSFHRICKASWRISSNETGDDSYRISIAVAGFAQDDLDITFQSNLLTVTGKKQKSANDGYLHRGIAGRPFEHRFELADHVRVNGADLQNGLLSIDLVREIPEALKPRKISIPSAAAMASAAPAQIEAQKAA